jgi:hypothetical protein
MSAFLGPIHYWLYRKINVQNQMVEEVLKFIKENNIPLDLRQQMDDQFGTISDRPLEEQIDTSNIHGWLQEQVSVVEYRLAYAVTKLVSEFPELFDKLSGSFENAGREITELTMNSNAKDIFQYLNDVLLDGMPCDHANTLVSGEDNEVVYRRNLCVHEEYWNSLGGNIDNYYLLRESFIKGLLEPAGGAFEKLDEITSRISK